MFFFLSLSSNSKGVAILFNDNFEFKILNEAKDINGNYLILDVIGKHCSCLVNSWPLTVNRNTGCF
jgi:hypothetical protein